MNNNLNYALGSMQYVKNSVRFDIKKNRDECNPDEIFQGEHENLEDDSKRWLNSTSNSCSFIAALIATVAFASSASVPGGVNQDTGVPILLHHLAFSIFTMSSLLALSCSMISLLIFLAIFVSRTKTKILLKTCRGNFYLV